MYLSIKKAQRLSLTGVEHKLMMLEAVSTLPSYVEGKDIVWTTKKLVDAGKAADIDLRSILNISWGDYAQYFKKLMQHYIAKSSKNIIFTAHTSDVMNESEMAQETLVKVKGSIMNQGVESYFSTVISTKKVSLKQLKDYKNDLLVITPEEEALGYKYVFQTKITKDTVHERMRGPLGMWNQSETYVDNNLQNVINRLHHYYA